MSKFEISETPTLENVDAIVNNAAPVVKPVRGNTKILKIRLNGQPYYHFSRVEFDDELATRQSSAVVGGKRFYEGLVNKRMYTRLNLTSI